MRPKWNLGGPKVAQKWTKVGPRARSGTTCEKWVPQNRLWYHFGVHFGGHFWTKIKTKNEAKIECVWDGVLVAFWLIVGCILGSILAGFGSRLDLILMTLGVDRVARSEKVEFSKMLFLYLFLKQK